MKIWFLISMTVMSLRTQAEDGKEIGNGGDVVTCRDAQGNPKPNAELNGHWIMLYDSFRARSRGFQVQIPGSTLEEKHQNLIARLRTLGSSAVVDISKELEIYFDRKNFKKGHILPDIPDSMEEDLPVGCKLEQVAINKEPRFPEDRVYTVNEDLLLSLSLDDQALTPFHEVWQRFSRRNKKFKVDAYDTQYYVGRLGADRLSDLSGLERVRLAMHFGFRAMNLGPDSRSSILMRPSAELNETGLLTSGLTQLGMFWIRSASGTSVEFFQNEDRSFRLRKLGGDSVEERGEGFTDMNSVTWPVGKQFDVDRAAEIYFSDFGVERIEAENFVPFREFGFLPRYWGTELRCSKLRVYSPDEIQCKLEGRVRIGSLQVDSIDSYVSHNKFRKAVRFSREQAVRVDREFLGCYRRVFVDRFEPNSATNWRELRLDGPVEDVSRGCYSTYFNLPFTGGVFLLNSTPESMRLNLDTDRTDIRWQNSSAGGQLQVTLPGEKRSKILKVGVSPKCPYDHSMEATLVNAKLKSLSGTLLEPVTIKTGSWKSETYEAGDRIRYDVASNTLERFPAFTSYCRW